MFAWLDWPRKLFSHRARTGRASVHRQAKRRRSCTLRVKSLEDRLVPTGLAPILSSIAPSAGPLSGGVKVKIFGSHLGTSSTATVDFGTTLATIVSDTGSAIVAMSPPGTGAENVTVSVGGQTSNGIAYTYVAAPVVTTNPSDQTILAGQTVTFTAAATAAVPPTVQWEESTNGGKSFFKIKGATSTSYSFVTAQTDNGHEFEAVFTNAGGSVITTPATLTVDWAPIITTQPIDHTVNNNSSVSFHVAATGNPAVTVQWQELAPGQTSWADIPGATSATLGFTAKLPQDGAQFRAVFTNTIGTATSNVATLHVNHVSLTSPSTVTFQVGQNNQFVITTTSYPIPAITEIGALPAGVTFVDNGDGTATLSGDPTPTTGVYLIQITASNGVNPAVVQTFALNVIDPPTITSANSTTFTIGHAGRFTVTTTPGMPATTTVLTESGVLPAGIKFNAGRFSGTPAPGSGGVYAITIIASNGVSQSRQDFTLTVDGPATITSADKAVFLVGTAGSFTIKTSGYPIGAISSTALPAGLVLTDNQDGTATISGTPTTTGVTSVTLTASNGTGTPASQTLTITVAQPPTITSAATDTFTVGKASRFTVTTTAGFPTATTLRAIGTLPAGVTFRHGVFSGAPAVGSSGVYAIRIIASNGVSQSTQTFTLDVSGPPAIISASKTVFDIGTLGSFTILTRGYPIAAITSTALPAGLTLKDNGDGTATISGTPTATGITSVTLTANNGTGAAAKQVLTLIVAQPPTITSPSSDTFAVGKFGRFTVTATAGFPAGVTLKVLGALPRGVVFHNGVFSGTPIAGSAGVYSLTIVVSNGVSQTTQRFTLNVSGRPAFISAPKAFFLAGSAGRFTIRTHGYPVAAITGSALPAGLTLIDNHNGTATITGTPSVTSGGTYHITITAKNSLGQIVTQVLTLVIDQPTTITSAPTATFTRHTFGTFTITTAGTPTPTVIKSGVLPAGLKFTANADGTATISGAPTGPAGTYVIVIEAGNGVFTPAFQKLTLVISAS